MRRSSWIPVALAALVIGEVALLGWVGSSIGVGWTLLLLFVAAVAGVLLVGLGGGKAWRALVTADSDPTDAALVVLGGVLLVAPGFLTDVLGLLCVLPPTRGLVRAAAGGVLRSITKPYREQADLLQAKLDRDQVVEGEVEP